MLVVLKILANILCAYHVLKFKIIKNQSLGKFSTMENIGIKPKKTVIRSNVLEFTSENSKFFSCA